MNDFVLQAIDLKKSYHDGSHKVDVLKKINISIKAGEQIAIMGPSGSGKSTLLHLLGGLEKPTSGEVLVIQENIWKCSEKKRSQLRNQTLGFVYQFHHLLPEFTALENTAMPLLFAPPKNHHRKDILEEAKSLLEKVGLAERLHHKPAQLSGGERQRVAIARALITRPSCILADEPTGNLDQKTAESVYNTLLELNTLFQTSIIVVTHDEKLASRMHKIFCLSEGELEEYT